MVLHQYMICCALRYQTVLNVGSTTHAYTCNVISIYGLLWHKMLKYIKWRFHYACIHTECYINAWSIASWGMNSITPLAPEFNAGEWNLNDSYVKRSLNDSSCIHDVQCVEHHNVWQVYPMLGAKGSVLSPTHMLVHMTLHKCKICCVMKYNTAF